jgi:hypothetical protein
MSHHVLQVVVLRETKRRMNIPRLIRLLLAAALLPTLLGMPALGCGGGADDPSATATVSVTIPPAQPPAGWKKFTGNGSEIHLPPTFEGGDPSADSQSVVERLRALGPDYEKLAGALQADPSAFAVWVFDPTGAANGFLTNVNVVLDKAAAGVTLKEYVDATAKQLPGDFRVASRKELRVSGREAVRLVIEFSVQGVKGSQLIYLVKDPAGIWAVTYSTSAAEFQARLPDFEKSAATFRTGS